MKMRQFNVREMFLVSACLTIYQKGKSTWRFSGQLSSSFLWQFWSALSPCAVAIMEERQN